MRILEGGEKGLGNLLYNPRLNSTPTSMSRADGKLAGSKDFLPKRGKRTHFHNLGELHRFLGCALQVFNGKDFKSGIVDLYNGGKQRLARSQPFAASGTDQLVCHFHICPLEPCDNRRPQIHAFDHADQSLSYCVAAYNAAENIDEYSCHLGIRGYELESLFNRLWSCATTDIKEVCRGTAIELYYIHSCHGETGAVD